MSERHDEAPDDPDERVPARRHLARGDVTGTVDHATATGQRKGQEDRFVVSRLRDDPAPLWLLAVMDGFGGAAAAERCASLLEPTVRDCLSDCDGAAPALRAAIGRLAAEIRDDSVGTTISVALVDEAEARADACFVGDSPIVVRDASAILHVPEPHHGARNPAERTRAMSRGALWIQGYLSVDGVGAVTLSRALGSRKLTFLDPTPDELTAQLGSGGFVLLATDGIYTTDRSLRHELATYAYERVRDGASAEDLVRDALAGGTRDNVTVVLWRAGS